MFWLVSGSLAVPAAAKTNNQADCHKPPMIRGHLLPKRSIT